MVGKTYYHTFFHVIGLAFLAFLKLTLQRQLIDSMLRYFRFQGFHLIHDGGPENRSRGCTCLRGRWWEVVIVPHSELFGRGQHSAITMGDEARRGIVNDGIPPRFRPWTDLLSDLCIDFILLNLFGRKGIPVVLPQ